MASEPVGRIDAALRGAEPVSSETKRRVRLADGQRKGFETAWNEYFDCYATTTYLEEPLIRLEDISYHLYLKKNINPSNPRWELPSFRQLKKILGLSQDKIQGIEARLAGAGLLVKESGKGKGSKGENVANDYLLYEPLELTDFLLAVSTGRLAGTLNEKGQRKLAELRERFAESGLRIADLGHLHGDRGLSEASATPPNKMQAQPGNPQSAIRNPQSAVSEIGTGGVPESSTRVVPLFGAGGEPQSGTVAAPKSGTQNRPTLTDRSQHTEQQQATRRSTTKRPGQGQSEGVVVAEHGDDLVARGITAAIASRLRRTIPAEVIARQVAIFDFLREETPGDPKLTPGRLRRQIEEDWAAPTGYVPAAKRAAQAEVAARQAEARAAQARATSRQTAGAGAARQALLDAIGLAGADQALWARIAQANPPLPTPFRDALFHAPRDDEAAAVIFHDPAALARATGPAHAATRSRVAARIADLCGRPGAAVHYLFYNDLLQMVQGAAVEADPGPSGQK
jgi:hypothetical protein